MEHFRPKDVAELESTLNAARPQQMRGRVWEFFDAKKDCQKTCQENVQKMGLEERRQLFDCIFKVNTSESECGQISNENTTSTSSTSPGSVSKGSSNRSSCVGILPHQTDAAKEQLFMEKQELLRQRYLKLEQQCDSVCGKKFSYILADDGDGSGAVNKKGAETSLAHAKNAGA